MPSSDSRIPHFGVTYARRAALKRWQDPDSLKTFATVYLPDATYKYQSATARLVTGGSWEQRVVTDEAWPLPNPIGTVPIIAVPNKPDLAGTGDDHPGIRRGPRDEASDPLYVHPEASECAV